MGRRFHYGLPLFIRILESSQSGAVSTTAMLSRRFLPFSNTVSLRNKASLSSVASDK